MPCWPVSPQRSEVGGALLARLAMASREPEPRRPLQASGLSYVNPEGPGDKPVIESAIKHTRSLGRAVNEGELGENAVIHRCRATRSGP